MTGKQIIILSMLIGLLGATWSVAFEVAQLEKSQVHIANQVIRFHVRANSDTKEDQEEKMLVKSEIVTYLQPYMAKAKSVEEGRTILLQKQKEIQKKAESFLKKTTGRKVRVFLTKEQFPVKTYGDLTFPPGKYEALRIDIGEGKGKNWWCVMYPSLCFVNETTGVVPKKSKEKLKYVLSEQDYSSLKPEYRFKIVELWKQKKQVGNRIK